MFTGIIDAIGEIEAVEPLGEGRRLTIRAPWAGALRIGASVSVDGVCLTVVAVSDEAFTVEVVRETVALTIIGTYAVGTRVHLERSLVVGDRVDGHLVQGHVDAATPVASIERRGENRYISLVLPVSGRPLVAQRGCIAINGVSLTVLEVDASRVRVSIVPYTWDATTFADLEVGTTVNVEYDILARYVQHQMEQLK